MTCGGLFSGIGGFELAAIRAGLTPIWSNEIDPYCCAVLRKNFHHEIIEKDIRQVKGLPAVDVIFGGFPCQPFSNAGLRLGTTDNRYLWSEMFRIVREVQPAWVIGENVAGIASMGQQDCSTTLGDEKLAEWMESSVLQKILQDLNQIGYAVQPFVIPACAVGAPHRRDRIWIIANHISQRGRAEDARRLGMDREIFQSGEREESSIRRKVHNRKPGRPIADTNSAGLQNRESIGENAFQKCQAAIGAVWEDHWLEVAARICRMDDGVPGGMDETGQVPAKSKNKTAAGRQHRIKGLGNAIVPDVAEVLFQAILKQSK